MVFSDLVSLLIWINENFFILKKKKVVVNAKDGSPKNNSNLIYNVFLKKYNDSTTKKLGRQKASNLTPKDPPLHLPCSPFINKLK